MLQATAQLDLKRKELTAHLQKMGVGLGGLGKTLVKRTTDLFDQVYALPTIYVCACTAVS